jgi:transposase
MVKERKQLRQYVLALCRRAGLHYRQAVGHPQALHWSQKHRVWMERAVSRLGSTTFQMNLRLLLHQLASLDETIRAYDTEVERRSRAPEVERAIRALMCFRGVDRQTAMVVRTELGDIRRFGHPRSLTSYAGLDIAEYSSGKEIKFGITHRGNRWLRTAVVEASQCAPWPPRISKDLQERRAGGDPKVIEVADRCMRRLYQKSQRLLMRGKARNKVKVACARELLGFVWEALQKAA